MQTNCLVILESGNVFFRRLSVLLTKVVILQLFSRKSCQLLGDRCLPACLFCLSVCNVGVLWPNGWIDQDETCYRSRPRPRPHCVWWAPSSPIHKRDTVPNFQPMSVVVKWLDGSRCHLVQRSWPRRQCVRWGPSLPPIKRGAQHPQFWPMSIVAKVLDGSR